MNMTDEQLIDLGRRAVACKGWRWLPGMLARYYGDGAAWHRLTDGDGYGLPFKHRPPNPRDAWPDLRDPATVGCLLALVREAWGDLGASGWHDRRTGLWSWMAGGCIHSVWRPSDADGYPNEAAALVAALEACNGA